MKNGFTDSDEIIHLKIYTFYVIKLKYITLLQKSDIFTVFVNFLHQFYINKTAKFA